MGRQAGGGSPPEGNRLPFIPTQKGPSEPPAPPAVRAAGAAARTGLLWRRQGLLVTGSLPGAWGQVEAGGERSLTPPSPPGVTLPGTGVQQALGFCPCHGPCQHQQHPQPCPGADPNMFATQTLLCATLGAWHDMGGQPSTLPGGWNWGLEHLPRRGRKGSAKQVLSQHLPCTSSWQGMLRVQQAEPQQWSRGSF